MKKRSDFALGSLRRHLHGGHSGAIKRRQHQQQCCLLLRQYTPTSIPHPSPTSPTSPTSPPSSSIYSFSSRSASSSSSSSSSAPAVVAASSSEIRRESHHHFNEPIERVVNAFTGERQENDELMQYTVQVEDHHHFQEKIIRTKQKPSTYEMNEEAQKAALKTIQQQLIMNSIRFIPEKKRQLEKLAESNPYKREFLKDDIHSANEEGGLYIRQIQSEEQQYLDAVQEQLDARNTMIGFGKGTSLSYVHRELLSWYTPFLNSIRREVAEIEKFGKNVTDRVVDRKIYGPYLLLLSEEKLATITIDSVMSTIVKDLSNPAPLYALTKRIGDLMEIELHFT